MADISSTVTTAVTIVTRLREIGESFENGEFKSLVADLGLELDDVQLKIAEILLENKAMKEKLDTLTNKPYSWLGGGEGYPIKRGSCY